MIKLSNHSLLVLEVLLICIDQCIPLINDTPNVVEHLRICMSLQISQRIIQGLVFPLLSFQLEVHVLDCLIVALQLTQYQLLVVTIHKLGLDLVEVRDDFWQFFAVGLLVASFLQQFASFFLKLINLVVKGCKHGLQIILGHLINVDHVVVTMLTNGASEADTHGTVLTKALNLLKVMLSTPIQLLG